MGALDAPPPPWTAHALKRLVPIFFRTFGQAKKFPFGDFGASKNSAPLGGAPSPPSLNQSSHRDTAKGARGTARISGSGGEEI